MKSAAGAAPPGVAPAAFLLDGRGRRGQNPAVMKYPENPALLAAVIADAEDDAPRLVYADWLEEHGDPDRAAFIRNQCALFDKSPADPDYVDLRERIPAIRAAMFRRELGPQLPKAVGFHDNLHADRDDTGASYHRGFPYFAGEPHVEGGFEARHAREFRDALPQVIETTTLRGLHCYGGLSRNLAEPLSSPAAAHLTALSVMNDPVEERQPVGAVETILSSAAAPGLDWLHLMHLHSTADVNRLAGAKALGRVRRLEVPWLGCEPAALRRLCAVEWFSHLRRVWVRLTPENAPVGVAGLAKLPELHTLELYHLRPAGLAAFAGRGRFPALGGLLLRGAALRGEGAVALGRARLPKLALLELVSCGLRNDDVAALAAAGLFDRLRALSLTSNEVGDKGVATLAAGPGAATPRVLRLGDNKFGKQGLDELARPGAFPELMTLDLHSSVKRKASADEVTRFLAKLELPRLRHLDLQGWPVDDAGAKALAANPAYANLTYLELGYCRVGPAGVEALFASAHLQRLVKLGLSSNPAGKAIEQLQDRALLPNLRECWVPEGTSDAVKRRLEAARGAVFI
jgi:uncharacterized protein (TIGR02996 family)